MIDQFLAVSFVCVCVDYHFEVFGHCSQEFVEKRSSFNVKLDVTIEVVDVQFEIIVFYKLEIRLFTILIVL